MSTHPPQSRDTGGETGIPFTQFLMPDGRRKAERISRPPEIEAVARELIAEGARFEMEMLSDYRTVSFEVVRDDEDGETDSLAHVLCVNGPDVPDAIDRLVREAQRARPRPAQADRSVDQ